MGKNILLVAATAKEIYPFLDGMKKTYFIPDSTQVDIHITGIGLTATAYHLSKQLFIRNYDFVIQAGVAGSFDFNLPLGTVVAIKKDTIADQSVVEMKKLKTLFDLKLAPHSQNPYKKDWLINPDINLIKKVGLKAVNGISVNEISTSKTKISFYKDTFNPVTESMEGAAFHYVCLMEKVKFIQIRSISNYIGERNREKWDMKESILNLNKVLLPLIRNY